MKNIFKLFLIVTPLLSCSANYTKVVLAPVAPSGGWVKKHNDYVYNCDSKHGSDEAATISTTGIISYDYNQKTLFKNQLSGDYAKKQPRLEVVSNNGAILAKSCPLDLVSILSDKNTYTPIDASMVVIYHRVDCNYFFNNDLMTLKSAKLVINPKYTACRIPDLKLTNHVAKDNHQKTKKAKKKLFFEQ